MKKKKIFAGVAVVGVVGLAVWYIFRGKLPEKKAEVILTWD